MNQTTIASGALLLLAIFYSLGVSEEAENNVKLYQRKTTRKYSKEYANYLQQYKTAKKWYYSSYQPSTVKGRCMYSPRWKIDGINAVYKASEEGYMVILYLIKADCRLCYDELRSLHIWAEYYKKIDKKIRIIAINHRSKPRPKAHKYFPLIEMYEEPKNKNIFKLLKGRAGDVFVYDKCGRHLYKYGYPYSSLIKPFIRLAVQNTEYHYKTMCGPCSTKKPKISTVTGTATTTAATAAATTATAAAAAAATAATTAPAAIKTTVTTATTEAEANTEAAASTIGTSK